jgi:tetratricopeptide (TPR) repeat protein
MKFIVMLLLVMYALTTFAQSETKESKIARFGKIISESGLYSSKRQNYLDSVLALQPDSAYCWQQKAMPLFKQKKYELGMTYLDKAVALDKENQWLEYRAFIKCIFQKSYQAAIKDFEDIKVKNGYGIVMDHSYEFYLGLCYLQLNEFIKAEEYLKVSIENRIKYNNSSHFLEDFYLGISQMENGKQDSALLNFNKSLKAYPQFGDAKYYKAQLYYWHLYKKEEGINLYKQALQHLTDGYSINEDNSIYEDYPYKVRWSMLQNIVANLTKK